VSARVECRALLSGLVLGNARNSLGRGCPTEFPTNQFARTFFDGMGMMTAPVGRVEILIFDPDDCKLI
jgi:hypothetical protein